MSELQKYEDYALKHNAAFAAFRTVYEAKVPPPSRQAVERDNVSLVIVLALVVVMVASVVVSSSRTIQEFGGDWLGAMAFIMLEGGLIAYSFFRARRNVGSNRIEDARRLATFGLGLAFVSAIGANVDNVLSSHGVFIPQEVNTIINLLVAVSAPVLAFISADVLALELMAEERKRQRAITLYNEQMKEWVEGLNRSWAAQQGRWGVRIEADKPKALPAETDVNLRKNTSVDRPSPKLSLALEWLRNHPEHLETESRKLGELIGVSHATANKARGIVKDGRMNP